MFKFLPKHCGSTASPAWSVFISPRFICSVPGTMTKCSGMVRKAPRSYSAFLTLLALSMPFATSCAQAVCRPKQVDRLLAQMGSRWSGVTHIVEDNSILNHVLDTTTSMKIRQLIVSKNVGAKELNKKHLREMLGDDVFKYMEKHNLMEKMAVRINRVGLMQLGRGGCKEWI